MDIKNISVVGAGTMGNGIAQTFAQNGFQVVLIDTQESILSKAMSEIERNLDRMIKKGNLSENEKNECLVAIKTHTNFEIAVGKADLLIEAATENESIKLEIFRKAAQFCPQHCILASNTSSISISKIASATQKPDLVIGMHFMNPVPIMKLVEVVKGIRTSHETIFKIEQLSSILGKTPVLVNDYPGFISNRILLPMINEAIYCLYEGIAGIEEIDTIMNLGMAHPMGPFTLADFIGLDVCLSILEVLYAGFKNPKYAPCPLLINMVAGGFLGIKSGVGFYTYSADSKEKTVNKIGL